MDLLNNKSGNKNNNAQNEMLHIFEEISEHNKKIAKEFFDFSKDIDINLLDDVEFQDIKMYKDISDRSCSYFNYTKGIYNEYTDRLILFLDAIGGNTMANSLEYHFDYIYRNFSEGRPKLISRITHALSRRYTEDEVQAKIAAIIAEAVNNHKSSPTYEVWDFCKENYKALFIAAAKYCFGKYPDPKATLYSFALARYATVKGTLKEPDNEAEKYVLSAVEFVFDRYVKNHPLSNSDNFEFVLTMCFLAINYDNRFKEFIIKAIADDKKTKAKFLTNILAFVPNEYFEQNIDTLIEILDFKNSKQDISYFVEFVVIELETVLSDLDRQYRVNQFLRIVAREYPEQYIEAMRSTKCIKTSEFYCDASRCAAYRYEDMYKILEEENPDSIKKYNVDFDRELLDIAAQSERKLSNKQCMKQIYQYLIGQKDISVLEPYFSLIHGHYTNFNKNKIVRESCIKHNDMFKRRLISLNAIKGQLIALLDMGCLVGKNADDDKITLEEVINSLVSENVPIEYRFESYNELYEFYSDENLKTEILNIVTKAMAKMSETLDDEYKQYFSNSDSEIFGRKAYLNYLDLSNDESNRNKDLILAMCSDTSRQVRLLAAEIIAKHKEYENEVIELLKSKKQALREVAVDVIALWGVNNYKDILSEAAEKEKSAKIADKIESLLNFSIAVSVDDNETSPLILAQKLNNGNKNKKVIWLYETANDTVHFNNGAVADDKYMQAILICYADMSELGLSDAANLLTKDLNQNELNKFAAGIFSKWIEAGAEAKKRWVLYFSAIHGGNAMIDIFLHYVKEWSENSRGAIAAEAIKALVLNGSSEALMCIDNIAHKFKHKQVKSAALQALDNAAEALEITSDELGDKIVPNLGFDEKMERIFDYGSRKFKVYLTPSLEIEVYDENDKKLKTMPAPSKKDNEEIAKQSNTEFKQMKKQLKNVISIQKLRLETALLADRRWDKEAWNNLFVKNPIMHSFAIGLIWSAYENDKLVQTFRYMEDGSFNTSDEDEYILPDNCTIGLVHPIDLDDDTLSAWKEQLSDYEIVQPIKQLEREVYRINDDEIGTLDLNRFNGRTINGMTLIGRATKLGWYKGSAQDGGWFYTFYREDVVKRIKNDDGTVKLLGNAIELHFDGMYIGGDNIEVTIESARFYIPGTIRHGSYEYDEADDNKAIKLEKINPRYFSEIVNQLETILKVSEESN